MENVKKESSLFSYLIVLAILVLSLMTFFNITNNPEYRQLGYLTVTGYTCIILLLISLSATWIIRKKISTNTITVYFMLILFQSIMIYFLPLGVSASRLEYYFFLSLLTNIAILASVIGNVLGYEKKEGSGFNLYIHDEDSVLNKMPLIGSKGGVVFAWLGTFLLMFALIATSGSVFIAYPSFGIVDGLTDPILSSFGVGDWENISLIFLPAELMMMILALIIPRMGKEHSKSIPETIIGTIIGSLVFLSAHSHVYGLNFQAQIVVFFFAVMTMIIYFATKSIVIPSAMHIGNNFWGNYFNARVFGMSAEALTGTGTILNSIIPMIALAIIVISIYIYSGRKK